MQVLHGALHPMLEEIYHERCLECSKPWTDNSRSSKRCPPCRQEYKVRYNRERRKKPAK